eukprot:gene11112-3931_t
MKEFFEVKPSSYLSQPQAEKFTDTDSSKFLINDETSLLPFRNQYEGDPDFGTNRKRKDEYDFIVSKQIEHCNSYWRNKVKEALDQKKYIRARDFASRAARKTPNYDEQFLNGLFI